MDVVLPKPGKYIVAVSGGVDSVVLLHVLQARPELELVVAHLDHGMRAGSDADRQFVGELARRYDLPFEYNEARLGKNASEAAARTARYAFLRKVQQSHQAQAIITAHHQDDLLETAIINMLRGTHRKGLTALASQPQLLRPLLAVPKKDLLIYAQNNGLRWREDPSNTDQTYLRNYVRGRIMPQFSREDRAKLLQLLAGLTDTNRELDATLAQVLAAQPETGLERAWFAQLPHAVAREVLAAWLRTQDIRGFDSKTLERLVVAAKTAPAGKLFPVKAGVNLRVRADHLALTGPER